MKKPVEIRDVTATITTRVSTNERSGIGAPFRRTAIQLTESITSIDVLAVDGTLMCRLNLGDFGGGNGNVDVILEPPQRGTFLAWHKGQESLRHSTPEGTAVHAVAIGPHAVMK